MKYTFDNIRLGLKNHILMMLFLSSLCSISFAQMNELPIGDNGETKLKGNYNIKMISSQGLQAVFVESKNPLKAIRPLTDEEMARENAWLNNKFNIGGDAWGVVSSLPTTPTNAVDATQIYADCDDDPTTFQSSTAYLDFGEEIGCTKVVKAYLWWVSFSHSDGGTLAEHTNVGPTLRSMPAGDWQGLGGDAYKTIKFKAPGDATYTDVVAQRTNINPKDGERKICFADVTNLVQGKTGGLYWVANLRSGFAKGDGGATSGWSLVVIYEPPHSPQRTIKVWDGMEEIDKNKSTEIGFTFADGDVPAGNNSISYLGIAVLDGENTAQYLAGNGENPEYLEFTSSPGGSTFKINPFAAGQTYSFAGGTYPNTYPEQEPYMTWNKNGVVTSDPEGLVAPIVYDGFSCSRISTWDDELMTNGNEVNRLPSQRGTLGYDAHHLRLPPGAMVGGARSVNMKYYAGSQGGTSPFMAYMAIETLQPRIVLSMTTPDAANSQSYIESTVPGGTYLYRLSARNEGSKKVSAGAVITDVLPINIDYVGNPKFYNGSRQEISGGSVNVVNQGADADEKLTITLPSAIQAMSSTKTDSIYVEFEVQVKDLSRDDIWSSGCARTVFNEAQIVYYGESENGERETSSYTAYSNATNGCEIGSVPFPTAVNSQELDEAYRNSHVKEADLGAAAANMNVIQTIQQLHRELLESLGKPTDQVPNYEIKDSNGFDVSSTDKFPVDEPQVIYTSSIIQEDGCEETYTFIINVKSMPTVIIDKDSRGEVGESGSVMNAVTSKPGAADGKLNITIENNSESAGAYFISVLNESNQVVYNAGSSGMGTEYFVVDGLKAGKYSVVLTDTEGSSISSEAVVDDPYRLSLGLTSNAIDGKLCKYQELRLTPDPTGVPNVESPVYAWVTTPESGTPIVEDATQNLQQKIIPSFEETTTYDVFVCVHNNKYQEKATLKVNSISTPKIEVIKSDTGCREFFLPKDYQSAFAAYQEHVTYPDSIIGILGAQEVSGDPDIDEADLVLTYYTPKNGEQTQMNIDKLERSQDLIVRVTAGGLCYHQDTTQVIVKSFQECYPIEVPAFFSPDDNGINDIFKIAGISDWHYESESPEIVVFDRYGKKVYSGNYDDIKAGWDGKCDGKDLPSGDYWYELTYKTIKPKVGHFTLKRRKE